MNVAIFHPRMGFGGSEAPAMWALEALKRDYRVALVAGGRIDLDALNSFCGTSIDRSACELVEIPLPWPLTNSDWGAALRGALVSRGMRQYFDRFDVLISAYNIADFGRPGIHFLADFSWDEDLRQSLDPAPRGARGLVHLNRPLRRGYLAFANAVAGRTPRAPHATGLVLANSEWSRELLMRRHAIESRVLYPPVGAPGSSALKMRRFVCIGRLSAEKRIERIIEIVKAVRGRRHDVELHIVGDTRETPYAQGIEQLCKREAGWIVMHGRLVGTAKYRLLAESSFGIHARAEEPFGIAVAEMAAAGCIPFVPAAGGPAEIVNNPKLNYDSVADAVAKIDAILTNPALEHETRVALTRRAQDFSIASFQDGIRNIVAEFTESQELNRSAAAR